MKLPKYLLPCLALSFAGAAWSQATVLLHEDFDYTVNTTLGGKNGGSGFSQAWQAGGATGRTSTWTVQDEGVVVTGQKSAWASRNINSSAGLSSANHESVYFSFQIGTTAYTQLSSGYFADTLQFRGDSGQVFGLAMQYSNSGYRLQAHLFDGNQITASNLLSSPEVGSMINIVGKLTFGTNGEGMLSVWINPENETSTVVYSTLLNNSIESLTRLTFERNVGSGDASDAIATQFSDILIGTDFASVSNIPEPASAAVLTGGIALTLLACRRRRRDEAQG